MVLDVISSVLPLHQLVEVVESLEQVLTPALVPMATDVLNDVPLDEAEAVGVSVLSRLYSQPLVVVATHLSVI